MNVVASLLSEEGRAERPALYDAKRWTTYGELRDGVLRRAARFEGTGERILLLAHNSRFWVESYLAILASGNVAVPLDTRLTPEAVRDLAERTGAARALVHSKFARRVPDGLPCPIEDETVELGDPGVVVPVPDEAPAAIVFTSGSTGVPKGVVLSHGNIAANTDGIVDALSLGPDDVIEAVLPLSYCFGTSLLHTHLRIGGRVVLNNKFFLTKSVIKDFEEHGCTGFAGVPSHFEMLLRNTDFEERDFPRLRYLAQAGGKMRDETIARLIAKPEVDLYVMYGQTEGTARLSVMPPDRLAAKPGSIGRGLCNVELAVLREDGTVADPGEQGQIAARGPNVMLGYYADPASTSEKVVDGWLLTGDLGERDADGDVFVTGRSDDMVKLGGFRSNLGAIRRSILGFEGVRDGALIVDDDPVLGAGVLLACVLDETTADAVLAACREGLPSYQVPRRIEVVKSLPRTPSGKMDRRALAALFEG